MPLCFACGAWFAEAVVAALQKPTPLAVLGALHFEVITDLAWSPDGSFLAISSYDGYCRCCMHILTFALRILPMCSLQTNAGKYQCTVKGFATGRTKSTLAYPCMQWHPFGICRVVALSISSDWLDICWTRVLAWIMHGSLMTLSISLGWTASKSQTVAYYPCPGQPANVHAARQNNHCLGIALHAAMHPCIPSCCNTASQLWLARHSSSKAHQYELLHQRWWLGLLALAWQPTLLHP